jgi:hypothetical protein
MRRIVLILVVAVLLGSCSGASDGATTPPPASSQAAATGNINASFDVGGHKLHLRCEGAGSPGSPTVVYLHGLGGDGSDIKSMAEQERNQESVDFYRTTDQAKALVAKVPDVPVTYLAARPVELPPNWPVERMRAFIAAKQVQFTTTVPNGRLVEVQSSHDIDLDQPELVIKEINRILETA